jgi:hypothetical protein
MRRLRWVELVDPTAAAVGKPDRHAICPGRTDNCCSRVALTLGHSSTNTEKITLPNKCPVQAVRARRRMPSRWPRASSWQRASERSTRPRRTARGWLRTQRHCPTGGAWRPGSPRPRETRVYGMCCQFDGAMRCFGPNVASESNALPSDDRERNPGACAAVDLNARPEGIEALSSHRIGVKPRLDFTIGICSLPQRLPVKLLQRLQPHLFVFEVRFRQLHVCSPECPTRAPTLPRDQ